MHKNRNEDPWSYDSIVQRNYGVLSYQQQEMLRSAKVVIVGVGCDGGMGAIILTRIGVGHITLVDFDVIEVSNLNRQPLCMLSDLGQSKVDAARAILLDCNSYIEVTALNHKVTEYSQKELENHDVILQCSDNFSARVAIHRVAKVLGIPVVSMTGQPPYRSHISTFFAEGPDYEEVMQLPSVGRGLDKETRDKLDALKNERAKNAQICGATPGWANDFINHNEGWGGEAVGWGITPERAYITATLQAHEALRIITGREVLAPAPRAIVVDLSNPPELVKVLAPPDSKHWNPLEY